MEPLAVAIRRHLLDYLAGTVSLDEFKDWIVAATWGIDDTASPEERQLAYDVELALAEESSGFLTREELHDDLQKLLDRAVLNV
jgi:hypothetical protein